MAPPVAVRVDHATVMAGGDRNTLDGELAEVWAVVLSRPGVAALLAR